MMWWVEKIIRRQNHYIEPGRRMTKKDIENLAINYNLYCDYPDISKNENLKKLNIKKNGLSD